MKSCLFVALCAIGCFTVPWMAMAAPGGQPEPLVTLKILNDPEWEEPAMVHFGFESPLTDIDDWEWHFGDGQSQFVPSPIHTYTTLGSFTVSLTVHSLSIGFYTVEEEDFIQFSPVIYEYHFNDPACCAMWHDFEPELLDDGALQVEIEPFSAEGHPRGGQENGRVICLPVGGGGRGELYEPGGRFRFAIELIDEGLVDGVEFSVVRLWAPDATMFAPEKSLAELRIRKSYNVLEARIGGSTSESESPWIVLAAGAPQQKVDVELEWYRLPDPSKGVLEVRLSDPTVALPDGEQTLRLEKLLYEPSEPGIATVQLGVIDITGHGGNSGGKLRVDHFGVWEYLLPNPD